MIVSKQEAFEESIRLRNQFRSLDEDEVDYLDSVLESERQKEEAVRKETSEQLDLFRQQQDDADNKQVRLAHTRGSSKANHSEEQPDAIMWTVSSRKRKRARDKEGLVGIAAKLRKASSTDPELKHIQDTGNGVGTETPSASSPAGEATLDTPPTKAVEILSGASTALPKASPSATSTSPRQPSAKSLALLGLLGYSSSED